MKSSKKPNKLIISKSDASASNEGDEEKNVTHLLGKYTSMPVTRKNLLVNSTINDPNFIAKHSDSDASDDESSEPELEEKQTLTFTTEKVTLDSPIVYLQAFSSNRIATCHLDNTLKIWQLENESNLNCIYSTTIPKTKGIISQIFELDTDKIIFSVRTSNRQDANLNVFLTSISSDVESSQLSTRLNPGSMAIIGRRYVLIKSHLPSNFSLEMIDIANHNKSTLVAYKIPKSPSLTSLSLYGVSASKIILKSNTELYSINIDEILKQDNVQVSFITHLNKTNAISVNPTNDILIETKNQKMLSILDISAEKPVICQSIVLKKPIINLSCAPDGKHFIVHDENSFKIFDVETAQCIEESKLSKIKKMLFLPDNRLIIAYNDSNFNLLQTYTPLFVLDAKISSGLTEFVPPVLGRLVREYAGTFFENKSPSTNTEKTPQLDSIHELNKNKSK